MLYRNQDYIYTNFRRCANQTRADAAIETHELDGAFPVLYAASANNSTASCIHCCHNASRAKATLPLLGMCALSDDEMISGGYRGAFGNRTRHRRGLPKQSLRKSGRDLGRLRGRRIIRRRSGLRRLRARFRLAKQLGRPEFSIPNHLSNRVRSFQQKYPNLQTCIRKNGF